MSLLLHIVELRARLLNTFRSDFPKYIPNQNQNAQKVGKNEEVKKFMPILEIKSKG